MLSSDPSHSHFITPSIVLRADNVLSTLINLEVSLPVELDIPPNVLGDRALIIHLVTQ